MSDKVNGAIDATEQKTAMTQVEYQMPNGRPARIALPADMTGDDVLLFLATVGQAAMQMLQRRNATGLVAPNGAAIRMT